MGGAGKKLLGHGARRKQNSPPAQTKDGGYGLPPHPVEVRAGQHYFPRRGKRRGPIRVVRVDRRRGIAQVRDVGGVAPSARIALTRLLAVRVDGQGRYFQHVGFDSRRYRTYAVLTSQEPDQLATLVLPEWHPSRAVKLPARLVPDGVGLGDWMCCAADLSRGRAAWLNVSDLRAVADPGPAVCHRPRYAPPPAPDDRMRPPVGAECGDIVAYVGDAGLNAMALRGGLRDVFVADRPDLRPADRVYLASASGVFAYLDVASVQPLPAGTYIRCHPVPRPVLRRDSGPLPPHQQAWVWRWWERAEDVLGGTQPDVCDYPRTNTVSGLDAPEAYG